MDATRGDVVRDSALGLSSLVQEPLTLISLAVFALTWVKLFLSPETWYLAPVISTVLGALSVYFTHLYIKNKEKRYELLGVPALIFIVTLFLYYAGAYTKLSSVVGGDYSVFAICTGFFLLGYTLSVHRVIRLELALALALFFSTLILHGIPAYDRFIGNIDPYYHYKIAYVTYATGLVPEHEYMVYPLLKGIQGAEQGGASGLDYSRAAFFWPFFLAYGANVNSLFGLTLYDTAILYPAVFTAIIVVMFFLLITEVFSESEPYNKIAAFIAAFILMVSPAFAISAIASNCEDDTMGMYLSIMSLLFFVAGFKRRETRYIYLAGFSFLLLRIAWGGFLYTELILAAFSIAYSFARFIRKEPCFDHVTYLLAAIAPAYALSPLILHARGGLPYLRDFLPYNVNVFMLSLAVCAGLALEFIRVARTREKPQSSGNALDRINAWIHGNPRTVLITAVVLVIIGFMTIGVDLQMVKSTFESRKQDDVIKKTIAEQHPFASSLGEYLTAGPDRFSILFLYALLMIPVLLYKGLTKADFGSIFILAWALPMMYGVYFKSQYMFTASAPITALGATVGLYAIAKRKDLESLRIVGLLLVLVIPFITVPFFGLTTYGRSIAMVPMHMRESGDRVLWDPALVWLRENTRPNEAVLTWWDYGHWITAESRRPVLIDNLQADPYEIQDIARFFVNATTEEDAMRIFRAYERRYREVNEIFPEGVDVRYVAIDWTMIGKGSALHFIATGNIDSKADGDFRNYVTCGFYPQASDRTQRVMSDENETMFLGRRIVFACGGYIPGVEFLVKEDNELVGVNVILNYGQKVPWKTWAEHNDASLLGVEPLFQILSLAVSRPDDNILPQYRSIVYVPGEFSDFMMTRLYLSDHIDTVYDEGGCANEANKKSLGCTSYLSAGLYNRQYEPLKNFRLVKDFSNGFVRVYEKAAAPEDA